MPKEPEIEIPLNGAEERALFDIEKSGNQLHAIGTSGNDTLITYSLNVWAYGNAGNDLMIYLGNGASFLYGGPGCDTLISSGDSFLFGGTGNDRLIGRGEAFATGGPGNDRFVPAGGTMVIEDFHRGDKIVINEPRKFIQFFPDTGEVYYHRVLHDPCTQAPIGVEERLMAMLTNDYHLHASDFIFTA